MAKFVPPLDNRIEVTTPENIGFEYRIAGPFWRLPAYLIDMGIIVAVLTIAAIGLALLSASMNFLTGIGIGSFFVLWFAINWFYGGFFETIWNGQTPGKRMMRLRVLSIDGQPINALQAVLRNVLRTVDSLPWFPVPLAFIDWGIPIPVSCYMLGLMACLCSRRYQRLGDLACGTMVIIEDRRMAYGISQVNEPVVVELAVSLPADFVVDRELGQALAKYVARRKTFSPARRIEIASHLGRRLVERLRLPPETSDDLLLCALYYRAFIADLGQENQIRQQAGESPFASNPVALSDQQSALSSQETPIP